MVLGEILPNETRSLRNGQAISMSYEALPVALQVACFQAISFRSDKKRQKNVSIIPFDRSALFIISLAVWLLAILACLGSVAKQNKRVLGEEISALTSSFSFSPETILCI